MKPKSSCGTLRSPPPAGYLPVLTALFTHIFHHTSYISSTWSTSPSSSLILLHTSHRAPQKEVPRPVWQNRHRSSEILNRPQVNAVYLKVALRMLPTCKNTQGNTAAGGAVARRKSCPHREIPAIPGRSGRTQLPIGPEGPRNDLGVTRLNSSERSGQRGGCSSPQRRVVHPTTPLRVWDLCPRQRRVVRGVSPGIRLRDSQGLTYPRVLARKSTSSRFQTPFPHP